MKTIFFFSLAATGASMLFSLQNTFNSSLKINSTLTDNGYENLISWSDLNQIQYNEVYLDSLDAWYWQPVFSKKICELDAKTVHISAFLQNMGTLSEPFYVACAHKHMNRGCCGITGPEDLIDLGVEMNVLSHEAGDSLLFKGTLHLNDNNAYRLNYIFTDACIVQ